MFKCKRCEAVVSDVAQCSLCEAQYDFPCAGITEAGWRKLGDRKNTWKCSSCKGLSPSSSAQKYKARSPDMDGIYSELKRLSTQMELLPSLADSIKAVQNQLVELKSMRAEFSELKCSVEFFHESIKELSAKVTGLEQEVVELNKTKDDVRTLKERCRKLETQHHDNEQRCRMNNIEIKGVPLLNSENLFLILAKIGEKIDCQIPREQISYIARVPMRSDSHNKTILCSVVNNYLKQDFISAARKFKNLSATDLGLPGNNKIYINDHLTIDNKMLLNKTKTFAKERGFDYVWVQSCKIFLRKNSMSPKHQIKSEQDLKKFF